MIRFTWVSKAGKEFPLMVAIDSIASIDPEVREGVPSNAVIRMKDGRVYFVVESFETLAEKVAN